MLILSRKVDQKIRIGDEITLTIIEVRGDQVKIGVEAPKNVKVFRQEVFDEIQNENKAAATQPSEEQLKKLFS
ncbi:MULTISPECIES: carbon storage regulator CsrA [Treponema]|jgi:carbon storage regulator|uniref:Translational regulator CsrA n=1 Tax=Treponema rectale TaxID=744512 RepID=A0A840SF05_9SPIR|nr:MULTISPECIES: carbon storage regulator CsrA [Treponema]MBB5218506.1 carbon storage regulator [Treponema rectale]MBE6354125.1 carbon storage regulator CsrA [Treponema sp.]MBO6176414.1 carbon storage regulator CsrA [Treponema sp.]QOS39808.1 carbon storage regulator [Treponema rectale]